jgi:hypothetical protein
MPIFLRIVIVGASVVVIATIICAIWICIVNRKKTNLADEFADLKTIKEKNEYSDNSDKKDITRSQIQIVN